MTLPFRAYWTETTAFIRRESHLLIPLSLATLALGQTGSILIMERLTKGAAGGFLILSFIACWMLITTGQLAISGLVLTPGSSVGEALKRAVKSLPRMVVIGAWALMALMLMMIPLLLFLAKNGAGADSMAVALRPQDMLPLLPLLVVALWFSIRTIMLHAVLIDTDRPALPSLKRSFQMTKGKAAAFLSVTLMFFIGGQLIQLIVAMIATVILGGIFSAIGLPLVGNTLASFVAGAAGALPACFLSVFAAICYQHLSKDA